MSAHVDLSALEGPFKDLEMRRLCRPENDYRPEVWVDGEVFKFNVIVCSFRLPDLEERRWAKSQEQEGTLRELTGARSLLSSCAGVWRSTTV